MGAPNRIPRQPDPCGELGISEGRGGLNLLSGHLQLNPTACTKCTDEPVHGTATVDVHDQAKDVPAHTEGGTGLPAS